MRKIKVLVVDDSALIRQLLTKILGSQANIEVVGTAADPMIAWKKIQECHPDVLTLDVEMPKMDGLTFLSKLMARRPMPVVMVSSLTLRGAETTLKALELGAIDFVEKPSIDIANGTARVSEEIVDKVLIAAASKVRGRSNPVVHVEESPILRSSSSLKEATDKVIAIGASTGGTEALAQLLPALPSDAPGTVVVQHMPKSFTTAFAKRLDGLCRMRVKEAEDGDRILRGRVLLAPGDQHMEVVRQGAAYYVRLNHQPLVNGFRPSVDVLFHSCAHHLGPHVSAAILTGMGRDGAQGMLAMRDNGAHTIAQNEETCVVFGMPKEAIAAGGAVMIRPLGQIARELIRSLN
ncbi:chemotaxis response regulator protein-glutamate methylesterase [Bremerella cremea]|uniref:Protein-glutamate methylesterase/protein-glutamine glutaminase n=1 Tax=Bremerella cremea TaxID=1031537 RepID=A0A368KW83_9BACT|nr:chemotaxis response regulator protein-glutamate methylesterase [Bremerella cremea]RCS53907.1 chemotaxis response regulator protein-glutamate methylesterase [Bremerella cremea]